jgi:hypothetical protein
MSHFLQRLASGVAGPHAGPQLRPLPGSIYARASLSTAAESFMPKAHEASAQSKPAEHTKLSAEPAALDEGARNSSRLESLLRSEMLLATERPAEHASSSRDALARAQDDFVQSGGEMSPAVTGRDGSAGPEGISRGGERASVRSPHTAPRTASLRPTQAAALRDGRAAKLAGSEPARRAAERPREPDEITIHIGRIEVAAIAQPAARPAPAAPVRKSINLDEYLRRGNGSAR